MIRSIDLSNDQLVLELLMLQQLSYRVEAERIGFDEIPPLWDSPKTIRESGEQFFGYFIEEQLAGAVSVKQSAKELIICRMMVHPSFFRRGIAGELLRFAEGCAVPGLPIKVSTGTKNDPAIRLYRKYGYESCQIIEIAPDVTLTVFYKQMPSLGT
ncbi:GNAT family N-acetyltransferase [Paenibacillus doosanensis]|uniref:Acetyltransferase (GNAT) family protein n=1 Tax=Paenibacillus konkukensis TaxID=2020716 RepID=A0ABY4RQ21_9BACL|nr:MULTISPECIES: GNAT family N-acetyltransferase [Paenibacillus]MCS7461383.1 GNAT family N-acetyltransferase [Paenibacillus doosanensis]UQZ83653.1 Acetyltransferase (GNAT) family protein [Paenibacillus konkukensis]